MPAASTTSRSGRVGAWSKELPGVAILKLSPVFVPSFSFPDRCLVNFSNILAPPLNCGWLKLGGNFQLDGRIWPMSDLPHMRFLRRRWSRREDPLSAKLQAENAAPSPTRLIGDWLAEEVRFPYFRGCRKIQRSLMPFPPVNLSNGLEIKHNSNPSY